MTKNRNRGTALRAFAPPTWREKLKVLFFGADPVAVARSLAEEPNAWTSDARALGSLYEITHRSGLSLWCANGSYGMRIFTPRNRCLWGGVTALSSVGLSPGHHLLRRAANRWIAENEIRAALRAQDFLWQQPKDQPHDVDSRHRVYPGRRSSRAPAIP